MLVIGSSDAVQHPRVKKVFVRAIQDQHEIQRLYEESQERRGEDIAYALRMEIDLSSHFSTRGIEASYNGKFSSDGGILDEDYSWARSVKQAAQVNKYVPQYFGPVKDGVRVNEENIASRIDAGTGIAFIPWCNGQFIRGHGMGVLVKFDGFIYLQVGASKKLAVMPVF